MLIADEVMAGFGRCGEWFAVDHWGIRPDLITFAKGVNSGYVPLGGVVISDEIRATFDQRAFPGGLTYSGHPLACASAVASINAFREEGIIENARMLGTDVIGPRLREIAAKHPSVGDVRGLGVFWAVELVRDRETREPLVPYNAAGSRPQPMASLRRRVQGARAVALHPLQPDPRRAALHHHARGGRGGTRGARRGARRGGHLHGLTHPGSSAEGPVCRGPALVSCPHGSAHGAPGAGARPARRPPLRRRGGEAVRDLMGKSNERGEGHRLTRVPPQAVAGRVVRTTPATAGTSSSGRRPARPGCSRTDQPAVRLGALEEQWSPADWQPVDPDRRGSDV